MSNFDNYISHQLWELEQPQREARAEHERVLKELKQAEQDSRQMNQNQKTPLEPVVVKEKLRWS